jgi:hypothetical protein
VATGFIARRGTAAGAGTATSAGVVFVGCANAGADVTTAISKASKAPGNLGVIEHLRSGAGGFERPLSNG